MMHWVIFLHSFLLSLNFAEVLAHWKSSDSFPTLAVFVRSLPYNIQHLETTVVVNWWYISNMELHSVCLYLIFIWQHRYIKLLMTAAISMKSSVYKLTHHLSHSLLASAHFFCKQTTQTNTDPEYAFINFFHRSLITTETVTAKHQRSCTWLC